MIYRLLIDPLIRESVVEVHARRASALSRAVEELPYRSRLVTDSVIEYRTCGIVLGGPYPQLPGILIDTHISVIDIRGDDVLTVKGVGLIIVPSGRIGIEL